MYVYIMFTISRNNACHRFLKLKMYHVGIRILFLNTEIVQLDTCTKSILNL